jgi:hypothetical protein
MFQALEILTPPTSEPVSLDLVRQHARVDHTDDDNLLALYVTTARSLAENYLARALMLQTMRYSVSDSPPGPLWPLTAITPVILPLWLPYPLVFQAPIRLPRFPVQSVSRVAVSHTGQLTDTVLTVNTDYTQDLTGAPARVLLQPSSQPQVGQHVLIDFVAGYDPTVEAVPSQICTAILFGATWLYEHRGDDADLADLPPAFYSLLTPYRLVTFG